MKVLMFSSDPENARLKKYAEVLDKLEIIDLSRRQGRFTRFWKGYKKAKNILSAEKFDLITAQEIEHSFIAWRLSKKFGIPWQMQIHTDIFSPYFVRHRMSNRARVWLAKFLIPRANGIRVVSERIKQSINLRFKNKNLRISVLPIFTEKKVSSISFDIKQKYPGYDFYILMVSRLAREKNFKLALEALREVMRDFPRVLLVIVGDGPLRGNLEKERLLGLETNVKFEGLQENVAGYYQSADMSLLTSDYEGYSMAAIEALSFGLPVIMTDVGVAGDIVKNGKNGIIIPVGDREKLIEAILRIIREGNFRKKLIDGAKKTEFIYKSFDDYRDKLIESFRKCGK